MSDPLPQLTAADLRKLTAARRYGDIERARRAGQLADLMAGKPGEGSGSGLTKPDQLTRDDLAEMRRAGRNSEITAALRAGRLADLTDGPDAA